MPLGLGLGITKLKSLVSGLRMRFQGNATITAALDGILRDLSADFVSNGTVTAALEAIKLLDVDFSGDGTLTADLASFEGLLDLYPNAAAAYSVRLLKTDYTGALVRIRKDTGGQPEKDFYPDENNELSLNSSDGGTTLGSWIGSNDGYIVTWYDQSGNSSNATQSSASSQPQILSGGVLNTINGKASINYNGTSHFLENTSFNALDGSLNGFLFAVTTTADVTQNNKNIVENTESTTANGYGIRYSNNKVGSIILTSTGSISLNGSAISNNAQYLFTLTKNSTQATLSTNQNVDDTAANIGTINAGSNTMRLSSFSNIFTNYAENKQQEIVIYDNDQTSNVNSIENNINDFFTIF